MGSQLHTHTGIWDSQPSSSAPLPHSAPGAPTGPGTLGRGARWDRDGDTPSTRGFSHPQGARSSHIPPRTGVPRSRDSPGLAKGMRFGSNCAQEPPSLPSQCGAAGTAGSPDPHSNAQAGRATARNIPEPPPRNLPLLLWVLSLEIKTQLLVLPVPPSQASHEIQVCVYEHPWNDTDLCPPTPSAAPGAPCDYGRLQARGRREARSRTWREPSSAGH